MALGPLLVHIAAATCIVALMLALSYVLGEHRRTRLTNEPYESGIAPFGPTPLRVSAHFYVVAIVFLIFDLEAMFLVGWAVVARELGLVGYLEVLFFVLVLALGLGYLWRAGALDWAPRRSARQLARRAAARGPGGGTDDANRKAGDALVETKG